MRHTQSWISGIALLAFVWSANALASFHLMRIVEVFPGTPAEPQTQYIVLQMFSAGQNFVSGHSVAVTDASGNNVGTFNFSGDMGNGADQAHILIATPQAEAFFGVTADLAMTAVLPLAGGKVCFSSTIDCVAWGNYSGPSTGVGTAFNSATSPAAGTAQRGLIAGRALHRRLDLAGSPSNLDAGDDSDNSATDFVLAAPAPVNNAGQSGTPQTGTCGNGILEGLEECDDNGIAPNDGCNNTCRNEFCGDTTAQTGEICDDGNLTNGDGCDNNCTATGCGNDIVTQGETCDPPNGGNCNATCQRICVSDGDCADSDACTVNERCASGVCIVDSVSLSDANPCTADTCNPTVGAVHTPLANGTACTGPGFSGPNICVAGACVASFCGDGVVDASTPTPEACDDGNTQNGDDCSSSCQIEPHLEDTAAPSCSCSAGTAAGVSMTTWLAGALWAAQQARRRRRAK